MPTLAAWVHNLNPYAIKLWEGGPIRWYGLSYLLGFVIAFFVIRRVTRVGISTVKPVEVSDLVVSLALGVVIGGRLGYCLFYRPDMLIDFHADLSSWRAFWSGLPWWGVLRINEGGMASHGGMIGGMVVSWWYARARGHSWPYILDLFAFGAPLGLFFGRLANFINGELYGRECSPNLPWAVKFPQEMYHWPADQVFGLAGLLDIPAVDSHGDPLTPGATVSIIIDRIQAGSATVAHTVAPFLTPRHPSQIYEAFLEGLVLFTVLAIAWRRPRKPLVIGSLFCIVYGLVRILGEFFRMPDAHLLNREFAWWHVTRGQWLSALLLIAGVILLTIFSRRDVPKVGGWRNF